MEEINQKFLRRLLLHGVQIALIMRNKTAYYDEIDIDDLYNNLRVYEDELKRSSGSNSASQNLAFLSSENTNNTNEVSTASEDFGVSTAGGINQVPSTLKKDILTRECRSGRSQGRRLLGDNGRSNAQTTESLSQALVAQDDLGGYDWSNDSTMNEVISCRDWTSDDEEDVCAVKTVSSVEPNVTQAVRSQADKSCLLGNDKGPFRNTYCFHYNSLDKVSRRTTSMPEDEQIWQDELEMVVTQELVANAMSNTPNVSAPTTSIGENADESSFVYLGGKIPIDASTLPNADLPIDPNMPDLEDASVTLLNDGIFNEAYDDDEDKTHICCASEAGQLCKFYLLWTEYVANCSLLWEVYYGIRMDLRMDHMSPGKYYSSMVFKWQPKLLNKHNMVAFLKKPNESVGFTKVVDFLKVRTLANGTQQLVASIDSKEYTITEASVRSKLQLADATALSINLIDAKIYAGLATLGYVTEGDIVPLLPAMLAGAAVDQGEGSAQLAEPHHTPVDPISSTSQPPIPSPIPSSPH
ncbi:hypothetical protein Tco_0085469 [Tanacetum coccineum]